jgi:hypothetical protein
MGRTLHLLLDPHPETELLIVFLVLHKIYHVQNNFIILI